MPGEYSLAIQNLVNIVETILGDKATKNGKIDLDNKDEVSLFTTMLDEVRNNNPNVKFDENEIARILGLEKSEATKPPQITTKIRKDINGDVVEYNEKGQKIKRSRFHSDGSVDVYMFEYNDKGQMVKYTYDEANDGKIDFAHTYEYDEHGNNTKEVITDEENRWKRTTYKNGNGKVTFDVINEYDENGKIIRKKVDKNGNGKYKTYKYS